MWYWILSITVAVWVFFDGRGRKIEHRSLWGIGTFLLMALTLPFYFATRPLKAGEVRKGGTAWNLIESFAICGTLLAFLVVIAEMLAGATVVGSIASGTEQADATIHRAIDMTMIMGLWLVVLVGALVIGLRVRKPGIVEKGPTGSLANL